MTRRNWTEQETMMAFALYRILQSRDINVRNPEINALAAFMGRTPSSVKMKLENLKRLDPVRVAAGQKGLPNGSILEPRVWEAYFERGDEFLEQAVGLLAQALNGAAATPEVKYALVDFPPEGKTRIVPRAERVNHQYFRNSLLQNYAGRCCVTGLAVPELLVASHIKPWAASDPRTERLSPANGLLLNALHDRAFDRGLITLNKNYEVVLSSKLADHSAACDFLAATKGQRIVLPSAMPPAKEFIEYHNDVIFVA